ncbi:MAG: ABC-F family ATP-binding cassette domain-containing protein [Nitrospinaceae bacterium]|jgi:ATP-binding cassette subfamily F protein 3|nr:ABC transporter ATP-binding protein [Nitrospinota bacterium]MDP7147748.1 ABC-F family ATP-binding cassette domain-containing protein [Nitrospinaceae bacterium]
MIYLQNLNKQFGPKIILKDANFHLRPNERVGLVGENGMGKTTLFRIITQNQSADSGQVILRKGAQAATLEQELDDFGGSVLERVVSGDSYFQNVRDEMEKLESKMRADSHSTAVTERYGKLQHEFERMNGYEREPKACAILSGLGFSEEKIRKPLNEFSGGWRMRVEMARLLLRNPDVLLLDEPTNHFDLKSVEWLEGFLKNYAGSLLLISHDRRFLNSLVTRVAELDRGTLTCYSGNYDDYERLKQEREVQLESEAMNQQRRISEIERFVERFRAKNTKATQVQSRIKMLDKMERVETMTRTKTVSFRFPQPARTGRISMELTNVDKSYGDNIVYQNFSFTLERGWKVALVGENGAGKSTLMKLLAGIIDHDSGEIHPGHNVTRAYYAQHQSDSLDSHKTVLESMDGLPQNLLRTQVRTILGSFLFSGDDVEKKVSVLSGGERSRLSLARMLASPASLLLLDEPTNHLDMRSCEVLAAALSDYEGTLCVISHDRYFLDGFINRVWEVNDGTVRQYIGNYSEYELAKNKEAEAALLNPTKSTQETSTSANQLDRDRKRREAENRNRKHKIIKPLKSRLQKVETRLEEVLAEKAAVEYKLANSAIYESANKPDLMETLSQQKELVSEEKTLTEEWGQLSTRIDQAETEEVSES